MKNDKFGNYDRNSQVIMLAWYNKLCAEETKKEKQITKVSTSKQESALSKTSARTGRTSRGSINRFTTLPKSGEISKADIPVTVVLPGAATIEGADFTTVREQLNNQYNIDDNKIEEVIKTTKISNQKDTENIELSFDDLLTANLNLK